MVLGPNTRTQGSALTAGKQSEKAGKMDKRYVVLVSVNGRYLASRESHTDSLHEAQELFFLEILRLWRSAVYFDTDSVKTHGDETIAPGVYDIRIRIFDEVEDRDVHCAQIAYYPKEVEA